MATYPTRYRLPTNYSTDIGRIVTRFAFLESRLRHISYALLELDPKAGRVAVRSPRIEDMFVMISNLMQIRSMKTTVDLRTLSKECKKIQAFRDKIAHGVWVKHSGSDLPVLQVISGKYQVPGESKSADARIDPKPFEVKPQDLKAYLRGIDIARKIIQQIENEVRGARKSLQKKCR